MNGTGTIEDGSVVDRRPVITCAGELEVFSALEDNLITALPQDSGELRRSLGRPIRSVHIGATFSPFSPAALPKGGQWDLIRQPLFHIYWTECTDVDVYKSSIRDDIEAWLKHLQSRDIPDWLVVVVENYDGKRANKLLPRTTVLDKIRADFAPKQGDRCISVVNPSKSTDSCRGLVTRIKHLLLVAYAKAVSLLEDHVRQQREKRNEPGWNFMKYFELQEELAQVLEMLGLNDEALVQYDELDALFSQFVVNGHVGDAASWLSDFQKPLERWHGLKLGPSVLPKQPSLVELRAYLFAKQAHMMLLANKIWEMASRCLPFLHTCVKELNLLEITAPPGAVSCWLFLAAMEVLQTCDKFNHADEVKAYSLHTACLWAYASQKLRALGELCGLMPGGSPTSEQLHIVVGLSAGMGDNPGAPGSPSPTDKLKEALCSQDVFSKIYLELAELAMGTYKHIGRLRCARLVGTEVASFYMLLGETQKSAAFLGDALRTFEVDGWRELAAQVQVELAECHRKAGDTQKFVKACMHVSAAPEIDTLLRWTYFDEMCKSLDGLSEGLTVPFDDLIKIVSVSIKSDSVAMQDSRIEVELVVDSNFPREVFCTEVLMSLETDAKEHIKSREKCKVVTAKDLKAGEPLLQRVQLHRHLDYNQDKQLSSANVVTSKNKPLKRKDSAAAPHQSDFSQSLEVTTLPVVLTPGVNVIRLSKMASNVGKFYLGQIAVKIKQLTLVSAFLGNKLAIEVVREDPKLRLDKGADDLLSGFEQTLDLSLTVGSYPLEPNSTIKLAASRGLLMQYKENEPLVPSLEVEITRTAPFSSMHVPVRILAETPSKEHQVTLNCPWSTKPIPVMLCFTCPLSSTWRLHTAQHRKFVQVTVTGQCDKTLVLETPSLNVGDGFRLQGMNPSSSQVITNGLTVSYMWELFINKDSSELSPVKADFSLKYKLASIGDSMKEENVTYHHYFDISNYETLYVLEAHIEPTKGNEFCRVGALCHLNLCIKRVGRSLDSNDKSNSLMYEVLAEQSVWAVCGRTAGVVCFDSDCDPQTVVLDVMPLNSGFLPLPLVRISKYIPAEVSNPDKSGKLETHPRLEPFSSGQVYNRSKGQQVHVIAAANDSYTS